MAAVHSRGHRTAPIRIAVGLAAMVLLGCSSDGEGYDALCQEAQSRAEGGEVTGTRGIEAVTDAAPDELKDAASALGSALTVEASGQSADGEVPAAEIAASMDRIDEGRAGAEALNAALAEHCGDGAPRIRFP